MADASEAEASTPAAPVQLAIDLNVFTDYLRKVVPLLLDDEDPNLSAFKAAVIDKQNVEAIKKFISDPQTPSLLFQRVGGKGNVRVQLQKF
jgi:dynein heavy chain 1